MCIKLKTPALISIRPRVRLSSGVTVCMRCEVHNVLGRQAHESVPIPFKLSDRPDGLFLWLSMLVVLLGVGVAGFVGFDFSTNVSHLSVTSIYDGYSALLVPRLVLSSIWRLISTESTVPTLQIPSFAIRYPDRCRPYQFRRQTHVVRIRFDEHSLGTNSPNELRGRWRPARDEDRR